MSSGPNGDCPEVIVLTKDRPAQVFALMESMYEHLPSPITHLIVCATSREYREAYERAVRLSPLAHVRVLWETDFERDLRAVLATVSADRLMFLVDDDVVVRPVDLEDLRGADLSREVFSLRLGKGITYCYTLDRRQTPPDFSLNDGQITWKWAACELYWGYPLSLDGHLLGTEPVRRMTEAIRFKGPNSYEARLQDFVGLFRGMRGRAYAMPAVINFSMNRVQDEVQNRSGEVSAAEMLARWMDGERIHWTSFGAVHSSPHVEVEPVWGSAATEHVQETRRDR